MVFLFRLASVSFEETIFIVTDFYLIPLKDLHSQQPVDIPLRPGIDSESAWSSCQVEAPELETVTPGHVIPGEMSIVSRPPWTEVV
ncbi:hypothetical protein RRG08_059290 [Elysia crispata]|uniref:Uncharacterized protein n=1 Tax=Elysia crispata TaxID=231223 RepID=A0AAE1DDI3_9GAST|nr:hypothetical protein RRG08_059290 [Elysia crispata]